MKEGNALSPIDGRYAGEVEELRPIFSEEGLFRERVFVELSFLDALCRKRVFNDLPEKLDLDHLLELPSNWFEEIKELEKKYGHDVKATELWLRRYLKEEGLGKLAPYVHIGLTSEDVNSIAYGRMLLKGRDILLKEFSSLVKKLARMVEKHADTVMLARTHGVPAVPTTFGKEMAVFAWRMAVELVQLAEAKPYGKLAGAVGSYNALHHLKPKFDWASFAKEFVESMGLKHAPLSKQTAPHEGVSRLLHHLIVLNLIIQELARDLWLYNMLGLIRFERRRRVGSSTMPHKVNPVDLENAEGQIEVANALLMPMTYRILQTRLQRDLSDSTIRRTIGQALAHSLIACKRVSKSLDEVEVEENRMLEEVRSHYEVLSEAVQVSLRAQGDEKGYERVLESLKELDRLKGKVGGELGERLENLSPENYIGLAPKLAKKAAKEVRALLARIGA